ncbi:MAG: oxygenase MpaB family protein, partial [Candidatus Binatia bacterium]
QALLSDLVDRLPRVGSARREFEQAIRRLTDPPGAPQIDYDNPAGDPGIFGPDSMAWRVHRNGATLFIGGVAAVLLELGEPRVRSGVWDHTDFRTDPVGRMRRTGMAAMVTTYGSTRDVETVTARVRRMHDRVTGETPDGRAYRANDPELLRWVHATAGYGFLNAHTRYVAPDLSPDDRDRYYAESARAAAYYGATDVPLSAAAMEEYLEDMLPELRPHEIIGEFLGLVAGVPAFGLAALPLQWLLVQAAIDLLPASVQQRLELDRGQMLRVAARPVVGTVVSLIAQITPDGIPERACRRMGLASSQLAR